MRDDLWQGPGAASGFRPARWRGADDAPSPLASALLVCLLAAVACAVGWAVFGQLDIVAVAEGHLVPRIALPIVQPVDGGVVRDILVNEGDRVRPGQVLLRLDSALSDADLRALKIDLVARQLQLRRIDAELSGRPLVRMPGDGDEAFAWAVRHYFANRESYQGNIAIESAARTRVARELQAAAEVEVKLASTLPIVRTTAERFRTLRDEGFVSELHALERERERIEQEQDYRAQIHTIEGLRANVREADHRLAQVSSAYHAALHAERAQAEGQRARIAEELAKQLWRGEHVELTAPRAGVVKNLATQTRGTVVAGGTVLLTLVPVDDVLEADVLVGNVDVGFVRAGQDARVKLLGYPFQKYGLIEGRVLRVTPDSVGDAAAAAPSPAGLSGSPSASAYRARVSLAAQALQFDGVPLPLTSGMQVMAEIRLGERTLLEYLLAPVRRAWHDAARER
jgi:HlyD family secretion protein